MPRGRSVDTVMAECTSKASSGAKSRTLLSRDQWLAKFRYLEDQSPQASGGDPKAGPGHDRPVVFQTTAIPRTAENELYCSVREYQELCGGKMTFYRKLSSLHPSTTHLIVPDGALSVRTEKLLSAIAAGSVWILPARWLRNSIRKGRLLDEREHDIGNVGGHAFHIPAVDDRKNWARKGVFDGSKVVVAMRNRHLRQQLTTILRFGKAEVQAWTMEDLLLDTTRMESLSLVLTDPSQAEENAFQDLCEFSEDIVPVVSFTFLEEFLTSETTPPVARFAAKRGDIIEMHTRHKPSLRVYPKEDRHQPGSPTLMIRPSIVRASISSSLNEVAFLDKGPASDWTPDKEIMDRLDFSASERKSKDLAPDNTLSSSPIPVTREQRADGSSVEDNHGKKPGDARQDLAFQRALSKLNKLTKAAKAKAMKNEQVKGIKSKTGEAKPSISPVRSMILHGLVAPTLSRK